jgi:histidinol phosphatase-like enzyme
MSTDDLEKIHDYMLSEIKLNSGRIDKIYYSTDIDNSSYNRKPNIGMGLQAKVDFPEINFSKSVIVGDSESDLQFGKNLGMIRIFIGNQNNKLQTLRFKSLFDFARYLID